MKKILLVAAVACLAMTSCKKDYTCTCTATANGQSVSGSTTIKDKKSKAKDSCEGKSSTSNGVTTECKIS